LLVREARNPADEGLLFDYGIVSSILHALVMTVQTFMMWEHEMPHMWADIPQLFFIALTLWWYHPKRVSPRLPSPKRGKSILILAQLSFSYVENLSEEKSLFQDRPCLTTLLPLLFTHFLCRLPTYLSRDE